MAFTFLFSKGQDSNPSVAARMSAAGDGLTEPNNHFCPFSGKEVNRVLPTQPTMRTEKGIGSEKPETGAVSGFFVPFFKVEFKRYHFPKSTFGDDLN